MGNRTIFFDNLRFISKTYQCSNRIEYIDEKQRYHNQGRFEIKQSRKIKLHEYRFEALGCRDRQPTIGYCRNSHWNAGHGCYHDTVEKGPFDLLGHQDSAQDNGYHTQYCGRGEFAQAYEGGWIGNYNVSVF